jgi:tetratricopeptide (TPR) repeat protein
MKKLLIVVLIVLIGVDCKSALARHLDQTSAPSDIRAAIDYLDRLQSPTPAQLFNKGKLYSWLNDWKAASDSLTKSIEAKPTADAYGVRALCNRHLENYQQALEDCNRAEELGYKGSDLFSLRGMVKLSLENYQGALQDAERAISLNDSDASGYYVKGSAEYSLNCPAKSVVSLTKSISLNPSARSVYRVRSLAYKKLGNTAASQADMRVANGLKE